MLINRHIGPIVPWRYTYLLGKFIYSINCSSLVTTGNNQLITYSFDYVFLGLTLKVAQQSLLNPLVDLSIYTNCAYQNLYFIGRLYCLLTSYLLEIREKILGSNLDTTVLLQ